MFFVNEFFDERHFVNHYPKKKMKGKKRSRFCPLNLKTQGVRGKSWALSCGSLLKVFFLGSLVVVSILCVYSCYLAISVGTLYGPSQTTCLIRQMQKFSAEPAAKFEGSLTLIILEHFIECIVKMEDEDVTSSSYKYLTDKNLNHTWTSLKRKPAKRLKNKDHFLLCIRTSGSYLYLLI